MDGLSARPAASTGVQPIICPLSATTADFTVIDSQSRQGIGGATVDVAQVLPDGSTGARTLLTTGSDGRATGEVLATMSTVTITSPQHGAQSFSANLADSTAFRTVFVPADGTSIVLSHTYQAAVAEGQTPTVEQGYADGRSLTAARPSSPTIWCAIPHPSCATAYHRALVCASAPPTPVAPWSRCRARAP